MCGIIGFLGGLDAVGETVRGLQTLEYRGYDSAGLSFLQNDKLVTIKAVGNVSNLQRKVLESTTASERGQSQIAIGHTRWATHGGVTEVNSHPHLSADARVGVVHNGIIENYKDIAKTLAEQGITLTSQTDTEVIPNLVALNLKDNLLKAVKEASKYLKGSYAFLALSPLFPDQLVATRNGRQPLVIGLADGFTYVSSDLPTARAKCSEIYVLEEGEFALVERGKVEFFDDTGIVQKNPLTLDIDTRPASKEGFSTFMEKEIFEIPSIIERIEERYAKITQREEFQNLLQRMRSSDTVHITACGTAYHAGLILAQLLESHCGIRAKAYVASELPYLGALIRENDLGVVISQSGETADTLSALQLFKERGLPVLAICNVEGSSIARYCDYLLPTFAGAEIAVASTKAFIAQVLVSSILTDRVGAEEMRAYITPRRSGTPSRPTIINESDIRQGVRVDSPRLPRSDIRSYLLSPDRPYPCRIQDLARKVLEDAPALKELAKRYRDVRSIFFLGKGLDATLALESALKVKEITYKHCEGFPSGELKHGTLALVDEDTLTIIIDTSGDEKIRAKLENARHEVSARGSFTEEFSISFGANSFVVGVMHAQLFALYLSVELGLNPDQPRNLAKSVTVE